MYTLHTLHVSISDVSTCMQHIWAPLSQTKTKLKRTEHTVPYNMTSQLYLICCIAIPEGENEILWIFWSHFHLHQVTKRLHKKDHEFTPYICTQVHVHAHV